jgi:WD40 repeat protein
MPLRRYLLQITLAVLVLSERAAAQLPPKGEAIRTDYYGDPLPAGAIQRLGTVRWRGDRGAFALAPDGRIAAQGYKTIRLCSVPSGKVLAELYSGREDHTPQRFSPDGRFLCTADRGCIALWDTTTGRQVFQARTRGESYPAGQFAPDSRTLVTWDADRCVQIWDTASGKCVQRHVLPGSGSRWELTISHDGKILAGPLDPYTSALWQTATGKLLRRWPLQEQKLGTLLLAPDGETLAVANGQGRRIRLFYLAAKKEVDIQPRKPLQDTSLQFSPDSRKLAALAPRERVLPDAEACIYVWDAATGKSLQVLKPGDIIHEFAFSPDSQMLALRWQDSIDLFALDNGRRVRRLGEGVDNELPLLFSADGKILAAEDQKAARFWAVATGQELGPIGHTDEVKTLNFAPDSRRLVTSAWDGSIRNWSVPTGQPLGLYRCPRQDLSQLAVSGDGKTLAYFGEDNRVHLLDQRPDRERCSFSQQPEIAFGPWGNYDVLLAFSPDNIGLVVASSRSRAVTLRDVATGKERATFLQNEPVDALAYSPDGKLLAVTTSDLDGNPPQVHFWEVATGRYRFTLTLLTSEDNHVAFSPSGKFLGVWGESTVALWELATRTQIHQLKGRHQLWAVTFTPSGRILAVEPDEKDYRSLDLWDVVAVKKVHRIGTAGTRFGRAAFSPDGSLLATGMDDATILLWDLSPWRTTPTPGPTPEETERLWKDLGGTDAVRAFAAIQALIASPGPAVELCKRHLSPVPPVDRPRLAALVQALDSDRFRVRRDAMRELEKLGDQAEAALRDALKGRPSLEVRRRIEFVLEKLEQPGTSPEARLALRATEILEAIGTPPALQLLQKLAQGAPEARLTREARASLDRLARRSRIPLRPVLLPLRL